MDSTRAVVDGEKLVNLDETDVNDKARDLADVRRQISILKQRETSLVSELRGLLGVSPSARAVPSSVAGLHRGVPVVAASSFSRVTVDNKKLQRFYPEIYAECSRISVVTQVRTQFDDTDD